MTLSSQRLELKMSYNLSILRHRGHNSCTEEVGEAEEGNINWLNHDTMRPSLSELEIIWSTTCSLPVFAPCCFIPTILLVCNFCTTALTSLPDQLSVELLLPVLLDGIGIIWILQQSCGLTHLAEHHNDSSLAGLLGYVSWRASFLQVITQLTQNTTLPCHCVWSFSKSPEDSRILQINPGCLTALISSLPPNAGLTPN